MPHHDTPKRFRLLDSLFAIFRKSPPRTITEPPPRSNIRPRDVVLRDAAYLCRRHLAGLPTSRRKSGLPERAWGNAMVLCRRAELVNVDGLWRVHDYPSALTALIAAHKERKVLARNGNWVDAYED